VFKESYKFWVKSAFAASKEKEIEDEKNAKPSLFGALFGAKKEESKIADDPI